jgi:hypothetical protein
VKNLGKLGFGLLIFLSLFFSGCTHPGMYHYVSHTAPTYSPLVSVYVDKNFGDADQVSIADAIDQWNYALNGHFKMIIVDHQFDMDQQGMQEVQDRKSFAVLKVDENNAMVQRADQVVRKAGSGDFALAFTPGPGNHAIYLVRTRIRDNAMVRGIVMHEMGHALGAAHTPHGLMLANYNAETYQCVDYATVLQVATYYHWDVSSMNYCTADDGNYKQVNRDPLDPLAKQQQSRQPSVD